MIPLHRDLHYMDTTLPKRPEIMVYLENVRKYDQLAMCWHESHGLPCQPTISHKPRVDPTLLDTLKWAGIKIDSDEET